MPKITPKIRCVPAWVRLDRRRLRLLNPEISIRPNFSWLNLSRPNFSWLNLSWLDLNWLDLNWLARPQLARPQLARPQLARPRSHTVADDWQPIPQPFDNQPLRSDFGDPLRLRPQSNEREAIRFGLSRGMMESTLIPESELKQLFESRRLPISDPHIRQVDWREQEESFFHVWHKMKEEQEEKNEERPDSAKLATRIAQELRKAKSDTQEDDGTRANEISILETAQLNMERFKSYEKTTTNYQAKINAFDDTLADVKKQLAALEAMPNMPAINPHRSMEQLQRQIQAVQNEVDLKKAELQSASNDSKQINQRIADVPKLKAAAQQRLKDISVRLTDTEFANEDASHLLQQAIRTATESEIVMLGLETRHLELDSQLNPLQVDLLSRQLGKMEAMATELKQAANLIRNREVEEQIASAREAAIGADPRLHELAERNQELAGLRKELAEQLQSISEEKTLVADQVLKVETDLASVRKQIEESVSTTKNLLLIETSQQVISPVESRVRLSIIQNQMNSLNTSLFRLQEERQQLADPQEWLEKHLGGKPLGTDSELHKMASEFVTTRKSLIVSVLKDKRSLLRLMGETAAQREKLIARLVETRDFLGENMLWVQSTSPVSFNTVQKSSDGVRSFFAADAWNELVNKVLTRITTHPQETLICTMVFAGLFLLVKRLGG